MSKSVLDLSKEFVGRRAIVTGGSRGIGAAIAQRLLDGGASVVVTARTRHEQTPKGATFIAADLRSEDGVKSLATHALKALGDVDILVNNAGAARVHLPGTTAITDAEWLDSVNINMMAPIRLTSAVLSSLTRSKAGVIINVSAVGAGPLPGFLAHYGAAKAALNAYTLSLAQEVGPQGIRVNLLTPGPIVTPGGDEVREVLLKAMGVPAEALFTKVALRRFGEAEEVAEMAAFLASDRARFVTGHNFFVDGGMGAL